MPVTLSAHIVDFLITFFRELNNANIHYCVLRNFEGLPHRFSHDIDLFVDSLHLSKFEEILYSRAREYELKPVKYAKRYAFFQVVFVSRMDSESLTYLPIDVWSDITLQGTPYILPEQIIGTREYYGDIAVVAPHVNAFVSLIKDLFNRGDLREKYRASLPLLVSTHFEAFISLAIKAFGTKFGSELGEWVITRNWERLYTTVPLLKKTLLRQAWYSPLKRFRQLADFYHGWMYQFFSASPGAFVVLIGPSGVGKSTITAHLGEQLKPLFPDVVRRHHLFGFLPPLNKIQHFLKRTSEERTLSVDSFTAPQKVGMVKGILLLCYYGCDSLIGHIEVLRHRGIGQLMIMDRYFYDFAVRSEYSNLPNWLTRIWFKLIPKGDVTLFLYGEPALIHTRKQDISFNELCVQMENFESLARHMGFYTVKTDRLMNVTIDDAVKLIIEHQVKRLEHLGTNKY